MVKDVKTRWKFTCGVVNIGDGKKQYVGAEEVNVINCETLKRDY